MHILESISDLFAKAAAWTMFAIGLMLGYEVAARYFFVSPTIWAEELSRLALVWGVFVGGSTLIANHGHIRVTLLTDLLGPAGQRVARIFSLMFLGIFSAMICWNSLPTVFDSFERGRSTGSMMDVPSWWMQAAIPIGFGLMVLQALAQVMKLLLSGTDKDNAVETFSGKT